jgi:flagellar basal-body rod modification protein FlgD
MSAIQSTSNLAATQSNRRGGGLEDLGVNEFMELLIAELQNQDPLDPMDNQAMVDQLASIRSISSDTKLQDVLTDFSVTQQLTTASSLIGQKIRGLDEGAKEVEGKVERVTVETDSTNQASRKVKVHVGSQTIDVKNVREIL